MRRRLTFANVTALLALFFALSAGSYAAITLPANSVTGKQIKDHSLLKRDFKAGQLPRGAAGQAGAQGAQGPPGVQGAQGLQGPQGPTGVATTEEALGPDVPNGPSGSGQEVKSSKADCPAGTIVTGGGFHGGVRDFVADAYKSGNGYFVITVNYGSIASSVQAQAICARGPGTAAQASRLARSSRSVPAAERDRLAEVRAALARQR